MIPGVFIIESLDFKDEEKKLFEGKFIKNILEMLDIDVKYFYIRTKAELKLMVEKFEESDYKYLHLSCHGNEEEVVTTLDEHIPYKELSDMFEYSGGNTRVFLSSCSALNGNFAESGLYESKFLSITGPLNDINFSDSVVFWTSFYHLMFRSGSKKMDNIHFRTVLEQLSDTFDQEICTLMRAGEKYKRYEYSPEIA
ncbi:hypothetical protein [Cytobacillus firmus]|uniref:hypothetical protein n=1 Tax=Cytobacillus firmus TaxID=1399 RepID=UPI00300291DB